MKLLDVQFCHRRALDRARRVVGVRLGIRSRVVGAVLSFMTDTSP